MIISLASLKGGAGKSTLALHLAHEIARHDRRAILVDADPQASATNWAGVREKPSPFQVVAMPRENLHRDIDGLVAGFDHCIIDTPPRTSGLARSAILASDLVLIPVQPSSLDIWAASETVTLISEAQQFKPEIKAAFVINRKVTGTALGREISEALKDYPFPVLKTSIGQRIAFSEASMGYTVMELDAKSTASNEVRLLAKDVLKLMERKSW